MTRRTVLLIAALLLVAFVVQGMASIPTMAVQYDEKRHLPNGYLYLTTGELHDVANPMLANVIAALPLLFMEVKLPKDRSRQMTFTDALLFRENDPQQLIVAGRTAILVLAALLGFLVFWWTREAFGDNAAILALGLYAFSPTMLGHATMVTTDLIGTLLFFATTYGFWKFCKAPQWRWLVFTGIAFGLAQITRFTSIFLVPVLVLQGALMLRGRTFRFLGKRQWGALLLSLLCIGGIGYLAMGIPYGFQGSFSTFTENIARDTTLNTSKYSIAQTYTLLFPDVPLIRTVVEYTAAHAPILVPYHYLKNFLYTSKLAREVFDNFLYGEVYRGGKWDYYAKLLVVKLPPIMLLLITVTIACLVFQKQQWLRRHYQCSPNRAAIGFILIPAVFFFAYMSLSTRQLGIRYVLPIFPYLFMLISIPASGRFSRWRRAIPYGIAGCIALAAVSSAIAFPAYLSYTNAAAQPPYAFAIDYDTGQGLLALKSYMAANGITSVALSYFGDTDPAYYGISYENYCPYGRFKQVPARTAAAAGIYAVSITNLQLKERTCLAWLQQHQPQEVVGGSLLIYNITTP